MKILVTTGIYPPAIGGPATHVAHLVGRLRERGHDVTVLTLDEPGAPSMPGVHRIARTGGWPIRMARTLAAITRLGRRVDLLYVQGLWIEAGAVNLAMRKPLVRKIVGDWAWERAYGRGWVSDPFDEFQTRAHRGAVGRLKALRARATRAATLVIVPSEFLKRCVVGWGVPPSRVRVVANAIEAAPPAGATVRVPGRVVGVGRLARWKGFGDLIRATAGLPGAELAIVGDGPERAALEQTVLETGAAGRVHFLGRLSRAGVMRELASASAFVLNSGYEGFPHVLLEAFEAGAPVVAADAGGIAEIVEHESSGLLVPLGDVRALQAAIGRVLGDPGLAGTLAANARASLDRYTSARMIDGIEAVLREAYAAGAAA